jgi:ubiquinol-cytochrome c reductase iron-sulfur subunit
MYRTGPDRIHRRALVAGVAAFTAAAGVRAAEVEPQQIVDFGEPIDVSRVAPGDWQIVLIDTDPVFLRRRTPDEVAAVRAVPASALPDPARDEDRAPGDGQWLVVSGLCTHAGCRAVAAIGPYNGWGCLCHGSLYDISGRVRRGPAKRNLPVVKHEFRGRDRMILLAG